MNRFPYLSLLISVLAGASIWALSPWATGHAEPWDASGVYYGAALLLAGLVSGFIVPKPLWAIYVGSVLGQAGYGLMVLPSGPLFLVGVGFLLVWSLLCLGGGYAGSRMRRVLMQRRGQHL